MAYTKSLESIVFYLSKHPTTILEHKNASFGKFMVMSIDNDEDFTMDCRKKDSSGFFSDKVTLKLKELYWNELIKPDGWLFVLDNGATQKVGEHAIEESKVFKPISKYCVYYQSHKELEEAMDAGCGEGNRLASAHFWHFTEMSNAIAIINSGYFKSREQLNGHIPYDNLRECETTEKVMNSNRSNRIKSYCRFYLRPRNGFIYSLISGTKSKKFVQFSVNRYRIFRGMEKRYIKEPVLMIPFNGHFATFDDLSWEHQINTTRKLCEKDFKDFNWHDIYRLYDGNLPDSVKQSQLAEFLVATRLTCDVIDHIYFSNQNDMCYFLDNIEMSVREKYKKLCSVDPYYFFEE